MNNEKLEFNETIKNYLQDDGMVYYYHITNSGNGDKISNEGLFLKEKDLYPTVLPVDKEFMKDPMDFIKTERNNDYINKPNEMILIGCPIEELDKLIQGNYKINEEKEDWDNNYDNNYIIYKNNILGYIDMQNLKMILNPNYDFSDYADNIWEM